MFRTLSTFARTTAVLAPVCAGLALPTVLRAQAEARPVVVVFEFNNNSIGKDREDYDGVRKGIQDLLITSLAANPRYRVVDRSHLDQVLQEQNMTKDGRIDAQSAVRIGKILGAQYAVTGALMSNGHGTAVMTAYTINMETSEDQNPQKIQGGSDDVLGLIQKMSDAINTQVKLSPMAGSRMGDAGSVEHHEQGAATDTAATAVQSGAPAKVELYARPLPDGKFPKVTLDLPTAKLYTRALDAMDDKDNAKAIDLFKQVLAKAPGFTPATQDLQKLGVNTSN